MVKILNPLLLGVALFAMPANAATRDDPDAQLQKMLSGRSAGAPVSCIDRGLATGATIIRGKAIVYRVGSRFYVNTPDDPSVLRDDDLMITRSLSSGLCNRDVVTLVARGTQIPHGFVILGKFVPYAKPSKGR